MFQFRRFPSYTYFIQYMIPLQVGFPIRKSPDRSLFAAPRSLSQLITSFIGSWCQGIPLALLLAWPSRKIHFRFNLVSLVELCRLNNRSYFLAKIVFITLLIKSFPLLLPSHNCIIIHNVQFSRYMFESLFQETQWNSAISCGTSVSLFLRSGGPKWTRTIDLTIISRVL